jgi:hypothetical protein
LATLVAAGGGKEVQHSSIFKRRRVRHVDYSVGSLQHVREALAGERVHPRVRRSGHRFMAVFAKLVDQFRPDESGSADNYNLHDLPFR